MNGMQVPKSWNFCWRGRPEFQKVELTLPMLLEAWSFSSQAGPRASSGFRVRQRRKWENFPWGRSVPWSVPQIFFFLPFPCPNSTFGRSVWSVRCVWCWAGEKKIRSSQLLGLGREAAVAGRSAAWVSTASNSTKLNYYFLGIFGKLYIYITHLIFV